MKYIITSCRLGDDGWSLEEHAEAERGLEAVRKSMNIKEVTLSGLVWPVTNRKEWATEYATGITYTLGSGKHKRLYVTQRIH